MAMKERIVMGLARGQHEGADEIARQPRRRFPRAGGDGRGLGKDDSQAQEAEEQPPDDGDDAAVAEQEILNQAEAEGRDAAIEGIGERRPQPRGQAGDPAAGQRPLDAEQPDRAYRCGDRDADDQALDE